MKIKLLPGIEYEDIDPNRVYEVISECVWSYIVLDDESDENEILKEDCKIVDYGLEEKPVKELKLISYPRPSTREDLTLGKYYVCKEVCYAEDIYQVIDDVGCSHEVEKVCFEEPIEQASGMCSATILQQIQTFTMNHKNLEISFEDGKIVMRDWDVRLSEPMDYHCDTVEQLEELMGAWEKLCKFKVLKES